MINKILVAIALFCLVITINLVNITSVHADSVIETSSDLVTRIESIKKKMQTLRFCHNGSCFYREISSQIIPPTTADGKYSAVISAIIDRPSASPDKADYHFELQNNRWQLRRGEEYTDVADYMFVDDQYEIFSVHNNRNLHGDVAKARIDGNLKSGYISLYFDVLEKGMERAAKKS
jgi:hypothetical protein